MLALSVMLTQSRGSHELATSRSTWHYAKVDLGQNWTKLALSTGGFGLQFGKVGTVQGWIWPNIWQGGHYRTCWHYPRVDLGPKWSILVTIDTCKSGSGRPGPQPAQPSYVNLNIDIDGVSLGPEGCCPFGLHLLCLF